MPFLKNLKTTELDKYKKAIIPFGATEQHGPFLPLGTDSIIMQGILDEVDQLDKELVILPNFEITCSQEHSGFRGTCWISTTTFELVLKEVINSISDTFEEIYLVNCHGGNTETLKKFTSENPTLNGVKIKYIATVVKEIDDILEKHLQGEIDEHAGNFEISTVLYLQEHLVKIPSQDYPKQKIDMDWAKPVIQQSKTGIVDNHPNWVISKKLGKDYIKATARYIVDFIFIKSKLL